MSAAAASLAAGLRGLVRRRVALCRCVRCAPSVSLVERQHRATGETRLVVRGIATCGSVHSCPMCAERILTERAKEITAAVSAHHHARTAMVTFTLRHARGNSLYALRRLLTDAYSRMKAGRAGMSLRRGLRYVGDIRAAEVTHGANGWHPHLHALWFLGGRLDGAAQSRMRELLQPAWEHAVRSAWARTETVLRRMTVGDATLSRAAARAVCGARYVSEGVSLPEAAAAYRREWESLGGCAELLAPDAAHGVHVASCDAAGARYISKLGLEVAGVTTKRRPGVGSRTTWQIAADAAVGDARARALWAEHSVAMFGARQLTWSRGLRQKLGLLPERSDVELAESRAVEEDERSIGDIDSVVWDARARVLGQAWLQRLHAAHAAGQLHCVYGVTVAVRAWDHRVPSPLPRGEYSGRAQTRDDRAPRVQWWELSAARKRGKRLRVRSAKRVASIQWGYLSRADREELLSQATARLADLGIYPQAWVRRIELLDAREHQRRDAK